MKNQKLIIGIAASALGILGIVFVLRKIRKDAAAARGLQPLETAEAKAGQIEKSMPGLTEDEKALLRTWTRIQQQGTI